jgi:hypothetical protein
MYDMISNGSIQVQYPLRFEKLLCSLLESVPQHQPRFTNSRHPLNQDFFKLKFSVASYNAKTMSSMAMCDTNPSRLLHPASLHRCFCVHGRSYHHPVLKRAPLDSDMLLGVCRLFVGILSWCCCNLSLNRSPLGLIPREQSSPLTFLSRKASSKHTLIRELRLKGPLGFYTEQDGKTATVHSKPKSWTQKTNPSRR